MSFFSKKTSKQAASATSGLAELALNMIHDGVMVINSAGAVQYMNPAAVTMTDCGSAENALGLDYTLFLKIESKEGRELPENDNMLYQSVRSGQVLEGYEVCLISGASGKRIPIAVSVVPVKNAAGNFIITFRNITRELAEEGEQAEFISTASHEMRTPVATIDGYLSLALNPQTATIDDRARGYLTSAHDASQHLGHLFQDLLDATKLDDGRIRPQFVPVEMTGLVKQIADGYIVPAKNANLKFQFGSKENAFKTSHRLSQVVYGYVDENFMREIIGNLIENAIKYTPPGGSIYVSVMGDGDRVLVNVTDTGIGISGEDLSHIFQKFYRADNSDTRTIGGTGLGLYLVKQRVEAMGGRVWAESAFGEGSTFYVSLPRLSGEEYEKRMIAINNQKAMNLGMANKPESVAPRPLPIPATPAPSQAPTPSQTPAPSQAPAATAPTPQPTPATQPATTPASQPTPTPQPASAPQPAPVATPTAAPASQSVPQSALAPQSTQTPQPTSTAQLTQAPQPTQAPPSSAPPQSNLQTTTTSQINNVTQGGNT